MEVWSLFSGAMGLDLGLEQAGLAPTLAVEIDDKCCATIKINRPSLTLLSADIGKLTGENLRAARNFSGDVYMMVGGPPCQSFSSGGKRAGLSDPRGNLIYDYLRLIQEVHPRYFVFENVANLITAALRHRPIAERPGQHWNLKMYEEKSICEDGTEPMDEDELAGSVIKQILADMDQLGYSVKFGVLDAADFGAPQHRLRFVMFGAREGVPPDLPYPTHGPAGSGLKPYTTLQDTIWTLRDDPGPHSEYTVEVRRYFDLVPPGGNWRSLPVHLQEEAMGGAWLSGGGKTGFYRRLSWDSPSPTITGKPNRKASAVCHPDVSRPLSVRESAAIQGFPVDWVFSGAANAQYTQVGNAVPVALGRAIGKSFLEFQCCTDATQETMLENALTRLRSAARNKVYAKRKQAELTLFEDEGEIVCS